MSLIWKIVWTVVIVVMGAAAFYGVIELFDLLIHGPYDLSLVLPLILACLAALPAWFAWKGTKLIPFVTILPVRIIMIVIGCIFVPLLIVFGLIGIWLKS